MTAEVCLMNRLAVVMAADSASTVSRWSEKGREDRYFKGANKIFQLSDHHPVGLMIFDSSDILHVPWEIVVKAYRKELGKTAFNALDDYAKSFFTFLEETPRFFPPEVQKSILLDNARSAALRQTTRDTVAGQSEAARIAVSSEIVEARRALVDAMPMPPNIDQAHINQHVAAWRDELLALFEDWREVLGIHYPADMAKFAELGLIEIFKNPALMGTTGLVFTGYGEHDVFPSYVAYNSCGIVAGKHVAKLIRSEAVTHENPAILDAFAQTDMSDTFLMGISKDVYTSVMRSVEKGFRAFVVAHGGDPDEEPLAAQVKAAISGMGDAILEDARANHAFPLRRVLGVLPVEEMAELAETLINLQSLKEKVTKNSSTVGGPVDVAIITKSEGLVWIKRKHFFDIAKNSRFALRQASHLS